MFDDLVAQWSGQDHNFPNAVITKLLDDVFEYGASFDQDHGLGQFIGKGAHLNAVASSQDKRLAHAGIEAFTQYILDSMRTVADAGAINSLVYFLQKILTQRDSQSNPISWGHSSSYSVIRNHTIRREKPSRAPVDILLANIKQKIRS